MARRDDIVTKVLDYHIVNGGLPPEAKDFSRSVKRALSRMAEKGIAFNKAYGMWEISKSDLPQIEDRNILELDSTLIEDIPAHVTYGHGLYAVYMYYFENYKRLAELEGELFWPCKIGRTDRDPLIRILSQTSTGLPEKPSIEFIIKTKDSALLETMIHAVLKLRDKQVKDAPGSEWFMTNPQEVLEIVKYVNQEILL